ncbi:transglutaminase-like domain-containing protein [Anthocerotibacter panamensis]|uniref:transglutaminase-like domain-containing protein n=1 Tax=Anthocerotibacter panamensis TaxID=2857077 RepID=UPI001C4057EF|nr:transglutaminase family protein [Anthocerotibacter panamensis]
MELNVGCTLDYQCIGPATLIFAVRPRNGGRQRILNECLACVPPLHYECFLDSFGNRLVRLKARDSGLQVSYQALMQVELMAKKSVHPSQVEPGDLPTAVLPFLYPSRYCPCDRMQRLSQELFGRFSAGYEQVLAVCTWIYDHIYYLAGSSDLNTTATDTLIAASGVCRDFAHLGIAFCRALGIPARFVAGYAYKLDPQDFHAYFEAYLDGGWYLLDATQKAPRGSFVPIAVGRDAADTSFANLFGKVTLEHMEVWSHWVSGAVAPAFIAPETPILTALD